MNLLTQGKRSTIGFLWMNWNSTANVRRLSILIETVCIFSNDIKMEFSINKYGMLVLKRGKMVKFEGIKLPEDKVIRSLRDDEEYKYLGILRAD